MWSSSGENFAKKTQEPAYAFIVSSRLVADLDMESADAAAWL
jgi:hypothetical protein